MRNRSILHLLLGLSLTGCGENGPPIDPVGTLVGTLMVSTASGGNDPDRDGFLLRIDARDPLRLAPTGTSAIQLTTGRHTLSLLGMAEHCSVIPGTSLDVDIASRDTTSVVFEVTCSASGVRVTTRTTGLDAPSDGYLLQVDGSPRGRVPPTGLVLVRVDPGSHRVALTGFPSNCTTQGPDSHTVEVGDGEIVPAEFAVGCTATLGVIGVLVQASGTDVNGVYQATVDGVTARTLRLNTIEYLSPVPVGEHVVSLLAPGNCSVETASQRVTVTAGVLVRDTVRVTFSATCETGFGTLRVSVAVTGPAHQFEVWVCPTQLQYYCDYGNLEQFLGVVAPNVIARGRVRSSSYNVELRNVPPVCHVNAPNPRRGVAVSVGGTTSLTIPVICS